MDEARLSQLVLGFWPARAISTAAELGVFTLLSGAGPTDLATIATRLGLRPNGVADLVDALVGLQVLQRVGDRVAVTDGLGELLDPALLRLAGEEAYRAWASLPTALRATGPGGSIFDAVLDDADRLAEFADLMAEMSAPARATIVHEIDLTGVDVVCDLGGADGRLAVALAQRHPALRCTTFDLAPMAPLAQRAVELAGLTDRVEVVAGDFFTDELPVCDVVVLSMVLLDWDTDRKRDLLGRARASLTDGGRIVVVDRPTLAEARVGKSTFEALRSLHLLASFGDVHPFTTDELEGWLAEAGFAGTHIRPCGGGLVMAEAAG